MCRQKKTPKKNEGNFGKDCKETDEKPAETFRQLKSVSDFQCGQKTRKTVQGEKTNKVKNETETETENLHKKMCKQFAIYLAWPINRIVVS